MVEFNLLLATATNWLSTNIYQYIQEVLQHILLTIQSLGAIGVIIFILLYIVATVALIPGSILTLGAGVVFGVGWGSIYVLVGAVCGEMCAFLLGRYFAKDWINGKIQNNQTFFALNQALNQDGLKIILLTRLSPVFPFSLLNYALGVTGISLRDYFLGSVGMIPMTIAYVYFGSLAEDLATIDRASQFANPELQWTIKIIGFLATVGVTFYLTRIANQALNKSLLTNECQFELGKLDS